MPNFYATESKEWALLTVKALMAVGLFDSFWDVRLLSYQDRYKPLAVYFVDDVAVTIETS
ncbi:hypothetical protein [Endozoicomonas sp. YOMI1]|uniref:hypothetical protein n=1 Tax=Endozoicomonas sp. YOMI1 TaxID=2828739 RepID=UPI0021493EA4|nr:hypothetical protein [Endozoicomonas sp. YOMI1]